MSILVTGGAGYIGSHTCVELLNAGKEVVEEEKTIFLQPCAAITSQSRKVPVRLLW